MIHFSFKCEVYSAIVLVFAGCKVDKMSAHMKEEYLVEMPELENSVGITTQFAIKDTKTGGTDETIYILWVEDSRDIYSIIHECVHLAGRVFADKEITLAPDREEPFAYYVESWVRRIWESIKTYKNTSRATRTRKKSSKK